MESPLDNLLQFLCEVMARDEDGDLGGDAGFVLVSNKQVARPLPLLLFPVADGPVDRFSRLPQTWRAFDEQATDVLSALALEPPKKNPSTISRSFSLASSAERRSGLGGGSRVSKAAWLRVGGKGWAPRPLDSRSGLKGA
jgi:hypothetical protein